MKMKKNLSTILLGASLFFGTGNKIKAQCECQTYNHDADEFQEEIICWKREGWDATTQKYNGDEMGFTIIYYSDKDNDDFHEDIRNLNSSLSNLISLERFYVNKTTGSLDYNVKSCITDPIKWEQFYDGMSIYQMATQEYPVNIKKEKGCMLNKAIYNLTKEQIYNNVYTPNQWSFYGGFGERVKKLINAGKNLDEIKKLVESERAIWKNPLRQISEQ